MLKWFGATIGCRFSESISVDDFGLAGKLFLPVAIVTAAFVMPRPEPAPVIVEIAEWPAMPAPVVTVEAPTFAEAKPTVVNVSPAEPVVVEETVEVEKVQRVEVPVDRVVTVEVPVRTCLVWDELPSYDLAKAITVTRPGEAWMLDGDSYNGLVWLDSTSKPSESELLGGWLADLEAETC
jgi:hypothetical protein